jgi:SAM-dependent methyltransferase
MRQMTQPVYASRPEGLRRARPWHRLSYIVSALPEELERKATQLGDPTTVLDYGSADAPYRRFFGRDVEFITADLPGNAQASIEIAADGTLPLPPASVDAVLSTQVLEHVADPELYLSECQRVLRPGGRLLLSTHGFMPYHPDPVDLWRWTGPGLQEVLARAGFEVQSFDGVMGLAATSLQLLQDALYWRLPRPARPVLAIVCQALVKVLDRMEKPGNKRYNALVYVAVAEKPSS